MDIVESLYRDTGYLDNFLMSNNEPSLRVIVDANFRKSMLLASASHFERVITDLIIEHAESCTHDARVVSFIRNKAISRQYHSFFSWKEKNCNSFLGLFGDEFKAEFSGRIKACVRLEQSVKDFLEIGRERNRLVHQDFGTYSLEKTAQEIHELHLSAKNFLLELRFALLGA